MSPTAMHQSMGSSPQPSPILARLRRQEQGEAAYLPSYLSSQWEMRSMGMAVCSASMAFSTGMTCMPMPAPPGGTMGVIFSRGIKVIRSKKAVTSGWASILSRFMLKNSALPGTNRGRNHRFSWLGLGFLGSKSSQLYSSRPMRLISSSSFCSSAAPSPVSFRSSWKV